MKENIKVSVIMPVYNHEPYIAQAIESVLMQKVNFKYELLIGEDCSTDNSLAVINQYKDYEQVIIFAREKNMHNQKIRNALDLRLKSCGEYIITLEGDDYWTDENKLQKQVDFLDSHPEYISCSHRFTVIDKNGTPYHDEDFECQFFQNNDYTKEVFERGLMLSHLNTTMYRNFYRDGDSDLDLTYFTEFSTMGGDYLLHAYLIVRGKMYCLNDVMSIYRKVVDVTSSSFSARMEKNNKRDKVYENVKDAEAYFKRNYDISFNARKKNAYASAVFKWYREKTKDNFKVVTRIIVMSGHRLQYTWWFIYLVIARTWKNCIGKRSERIKF